MVPHLRTDPAQPSLTSGFLWDQVFSRWFDPLTMRNVEITVYLCGNVRPGTVYGPSQNFAHLLALHF